jgi:hypothetical protein
LSADELRQRLAAILAADVVGYSRLMAADEPATVVALDAARAIFRAQIESNHGRVIDMAGDSVLAVFETAIGAVSAALAIQSTLHDTLTGVPEDRRMRFRIGVHIGRSRAPHRVLAQSRPTGMTALRRDILRVNAGTRHRFAIYCRPAVADLGLDASTQQILSDASGYPLPGRRTVQHSQRT